MKNQLILLTLCLTASVGMGAVTPVTSVSASGSNLQVGTITVGSSVYLAVELATGTSTNNTPTPTSLPNMDDFFLATGHGNPGNTGGSSVSLPVRTILFGGGNFTSVATVAKPADFFIFEAGSGDSINVAPIFPDDSIGQNTAISGASSWANTGLTGVFQNQNVMGSSFSITDLLNAGGIPLTAATTIKGIAITTGGGVDPVGIYAVVAPPAVFFDHLEIDVASPQTAGAAFNVTIRAEDLNGVIVNDNTLVVTIASPTAGSLMEFDWNADGIYGDNSGTLGDGEIIIRARNKKAQTVSLVATQGAVSTISPPMVTTVAGPFVKLQALVPGETTAPGTDTGKTGAPVGQLQGVAFTVSVTGVDENWNPVDSSDLIGITSSDGSASLPTSGPLVAGKAAFSVVFNQSAGPYTVTATDLTNGSIPSSETAPITSISFYRWGGDGTANVWDTTAQVWTIPPSLTPISYVDGNLAVFDDTGSNSPSITIGTVLPSAVSVNSAVKDYTFQGAGISGTASLIKEGASVLTLTVDNTYSGATTVNGGLLELKSEFALPGGNSDIGGTSALTLDGGVLGLASHDFSRGLGTDVTQVRLIGTNSGFAAIGADRTVFLNNSAGTIPTFGSPTFFPTDGVFMLGHEKATHTLDFQNIIDFGNPGGNRVFRIENGSAEIDAILSGQLRDTSASPGNFIKTGAGTLQLSALGNNYEGTTQVQDGRLVITGTIYSGVGTTRARSVTLGSGTSSGILQLGDANDKRDQSLGAVLVSGTGTGNAVVGGYEFGFSVLTINSTTGNQTYNGRLGGVGLQNNLALTKTGAGTFTLAGTNTYLGDTTINGGTLALGANNVIPETPIIIANGTLDAGTFSDTLGPLSPASPSSKINLGVGGSLSFADSRLQPWGTNIINITGSFVSGSSIRFGTDADGLDLAQLSQVLINGAVGSYALSPTGYLIVAPQDPFVAWSGGAAFDGDTNNDGVKNGLAWFLGAADKDVNALGLLPKVTRNAGGMVLEFDCLDTAGRGASVFSVQYGSDLATWAGGTTVPGAVGSFTAGVVDFEVTDPAPPGGFLKVVATVPAGEAVAGKLFGRIKAEK